MTPEVLEQAACLQIPLKLSDNLFFDDHSVAQAKRVCGVCPIREACLDAALAEEGDVTAAGRFGVRGGKSTTQRSAISRKRRPKVEPTVAPVFNHGTVRGYTRMKCRCEACVGAYLPYREKRLAAERARKKRSA